MKNVILISPTFPKTYYQFAKALKQVGANTLCIGQDDYDSLSQEVKDSMTAYYRVNNLANYDEMYRAVAWFAHKYGKIDWLESNNEYWLVQDAKLRQDFHITSGEMGDAIQRFKHKSIMKQYYQKANVKTARYHLCSTIDKAKAFIATVGYPVVVKPDDGVGASTTWKIVDDKGLTDFFNKPDVERFIMEEYVEGYIVSYDGLCDQDGKIIFETQHVFPVGIMDVVNECQESIYYSMRTIDDDLKAIGQRVISAFLPKGRFFHTEYFRLTKDKPGLADKGELVALEVNMRPPGGYTTDMMNYANDINIYALYANMVVYNKVLLPSERPYYCLYCGKRDGLHYKYDESYLYSHFYNNICMHERMPDILSDALGNDMYIARFKTMKEVQQFIKITMQKKKGNK